MNHDAQDAPEGAFPIPRYNLHGCTLDEPHTPVPFAESDVRGRGRPPARIEDSLRQLTLAEITDRIDRLVLTGDAEYTPTELAEQVRLLVNELRRQGTRINAYLNLVQ